MRKLYLLHMAFFMIFLILSMPFYSANALAALTITKNSGQGNIEGFVDAAGDIWQVNVNARLANDGAVTRTNVKVNNQAFDSCVQSVSGYDCSYSWDYRSRRQLGEMEYNIDVKLYDSSGAESDTASTKLTADGSSPRISNFDAYQNQANIIVAFDVQDMPSKCAGLEKIEIYRNDSLLTTITDNLVNSSGDKCGAVSRNERFSLTGSGSIKVKAYDKLGHTATADKSIIADMIAPVINASTFTIGNYGRYIPHDVNEPVSIEVVESGRVNVTLNGGSFNNEEASCSRIGNAYRCTWNARQITAGEVQLTVTATDGAGNVHSKTITAFSVDSQAPVVEFFGVNEFNGQGFAAEGINTFTARIKDTESGLKSATANFVSISRLGRTAQEGACGENTAGEYDCTWENIRVDSEGEISITVEDKAGNKNTITKTLLIDNVAPIIQNIEVTADGKYYYQSRDRLTFAFDVIEENGFKAYINTSSLVDEETAEARCAAEKCEVIVGPINPFAGDIVKIPIIAEDTAGNKAVSVVEIQIFGTEDDLRNPDFWKVAKVKGAMLDASIAKLAPQRAMFTLNLMKKGTGNVEVMNTMLVGCDNTEARLLNNVRGSVKPVLMIQMAPMEVSEEGSELLESYGYNCTIRLRSRVGNEIVQQLEEESFIANVTFGYSEFDMDLENIEEKIKDEKKSIKSTWGWVGILNKVFTWVKIICSILGVLTALFNILQAITSGTDSFRGTPYVGVAIGACEGGAATEISLDGLVDYLQVLCAIGSCNTETIEGASSSPSKAFNWVSKWRGTVLDAYNNYWGGGIPGYSLSDIPYIGNHAKAKSVYDNMGLSIAGICIPGIIYNLEKYRQVQCRYVSCLENEVKGGIATIEACRELKDYQECKYFYGELFQLVPLANGINNLLGFFKSWITDPVGIVRAVVVGGCAKALCGASGTAETGCVVAGYIIHLIDTVAQAISIFNQVKTTTKGDYCSQVGL